MGVSEAKNATPNGPAKPGNGCQPRSTRSGFSLVEILVVITIIGVLIALLVVALGGAQTTVQRAAIVNEISGMSQGLKRLTTDYTVEYPPDFSPTNPPMLIRVQIDRYMAKMFRNRNPNTDVPRQAGAGFLPQQLENLDPAEALWFWLRGFSKDPQNPLFGPPNIVDPSLVERTPFMEMDPAQLRDEDQDGFLEYYPPYGNQRPYVYLVNSNYVWNFVNPNPQQLRIRFSAQNPSAQLLGPRPYLSTATETTPNPYVRQRYANPDSFQIIACGLDGDFGEPVPNTGISGMQPQPGMQPPPGQPGPHVAFTFPNGPYPLKPHLDNVTNFAEGTLESRVP